MLNLAEAPARLIAQRFAPHPASDTSPEPQKQSLNARIAARAIGLLFDACDKLDQAGDLQLFDRVYDVLLERLGLAPEELEART